MVRATKLRPVGGPRRAVLGVPPRAGHEVRGVEPIDVVAAPDDLRGHAAPVGELRDALDRVAHDILAVIDRARATNRRPSSTYSASRSARDCARPRSGACSARCSRRCRYRSGSNPRRLCLRGRSVGTRSTKSSFSDLQHVLPRRAVVGPLPPAAALPALAPLPLAVELRRSSVPSIRNSVAAGLAGRPSHGGQRTATPPAVR